MAGPPLLPPLVQQGPSHVVRGLGRRGPCDGAAGPWRLVSWRTRVPGRPRSRRPALAGRAAKAALYYYFKSREDIVASLVEDYFAQIDDLIAWGASQPATPQTRAEILRRYVAIMAEGHRAFRMLHQNQAAVHSMAGPKGRSELFRERLTPLIELLVEPGATLAGRLRPAMALGGMSFGWMFFADQVPDRGELCAALLEIACELADADRGERP